MVSLAPIPWVLFVREMGRLQLGMFSLNPSLCDISFSSTGLSYLLATILLLPMFYLSCRLEIKMIFLEFSPGLLLSLAVQLLELRLFFRDSHRILSPAEEHLDFIVFYSQGFSSVDGWCLEGRRATDCSRWIYLKL